MGIDLLPALAKRAVAGDSTAMEELLAELRPLVIRTVRLIVGPGAPAAEDAAQEALLDIYKGLGTLRDAQAIRQWTITVCTRRAIRSSRLERLRWSRLVSLDHSAEFVLLDEPGQDLARHFYRLPTRMRAVAVLRLYVGLTESETSVALGCSVGTVKSQLSEARQRLRLSLEQEVGR